MTRDPNSPAPERDPTDPSSLLDSVYEVALNPARYDELVAQWHKELLATSADAGATAPLAEHFQRATEILEKVHPDDWQLGTKIAAADRSQTVSMPELTLTETGAILAANYAATALLSARAGGQVDELDLPPTARQAVMAVIARLDAERTISKLPAAAAKAREPKVLRITRSSDDRPLVVLLSQTKMADQPAYQLRCAEIVWPETFGPLLAQAFDLTKAECDIVQALVAGLNTAGIAATRGTSKETVRTQIRELLAKTGTHSQLELIRMTIGFSMMSQQAESRSLASAHQQQSLKVASDSPAIDTRSSIITLDSGRQLEIIEYGPAEGEPVLVFHDEVIGDAFVLPLVRELRDDMEAAKERRFIVPVRAGYGATTATTDTSTADQQAHNRHMQQALAARIAGGFKVPILAHGNGIYFACQFARAHESLAGPITIIAGSLPIPTTNGSGSTPADLSAGGSRYSAFMAGMSRRAPSMLRFAVQAGFAMYARVGARRFLDRVYGDVLVDKQIIHNDNAMQDLEHGGRLTLAQGYRGFLQDEQTLSTDWTELLLATPVELRILLGDQEQPLRRARAERLDALANHVSLIDVHDAGFFAAFSATSTVARVLFAR